ncbi:MAG: hypothetical protein WBA89_13525 [Microcoleus sp.]|uniref:hypothetical protein n=1 Tax=Microcoleus sp. TaxID=44472 RepID=UPI003C794A07
MSATAIDITSAVLRSAFLEIIPILKSMATFENWYNFSLLSLTQGRSQTGFFTKYTGYSPPQPSETRFRLEIRKSSVVIST